MNHSNYELPSIYNQKTEHYESIDEQQHNDSFDLRVGPSQQQGLLPDDNNNDILDSSLQRHENKDRQLGWLLLVTPLLVLVFTVVPAIASLPTIGSMTSGNAIWRLIDPVSLIAYYSNNIVVVFEVNGFPWITKFTFFKLCYMFVCRYSLFLRSYLSCFVQM